MDVYLRELYNQIIISIKNKTKSYNTTCPRCPAGLYKFIREVEGLNDVTFNFNEEGKLHSKYLDDRYEPAIIIRNSLYDHRSVYYYLFDGEIKDCMHPFSIVTHRSNMYITYYSSERIKQELPIDIIEQEFTVIKTYNRYKLKSLIEGYKSGSVEINIVGYPKQDYFLHDCMEPTVTFKFVD